MNSEREVNDREYARLVAEESLIFDVTEEISRVLDEKNISRTELAEKLGKSKGFISQVLSGERNMTLRTIAAIAHTLEHRFEVRAVSEHLKSARSTQRHGVLVKPRGFDPQGRKAFSPQDAFAWKGMTVGTFGGRTKAEHLGDTRIEFGPSPSSDPDHEYSLAS